MDNYIVFKLFRAIGVALFRCNKIDEANEVFSTYIKTLLTIPDSEKEIEKTRNAMISLLNKNSFDLQETTAKKLLHFQFELKNKISDETLLECASLINLTEQYDLSTEYLNLVKKKNGEFYRILGDIYYKQNNQELAAKNYKKAIKTIKNNPYLYNRLGNIYENFYDTDFDEKNLKKALKYFTKAYEVKNDNKFLKNKIIITQKLGRTKNLKELWDKLLKSNPNATDYWDYACYCINIGDFETAKQYIDYRFKKEKEPTYYPDINKPMWDCKKDISDKTLLVHWEQGFGDTFMFYRFLNIAKHKAKKLIFITQKETIRLFQKSGFDFEIHPDGTDLNSLNFDYHVPLMSLMKLGDFSKAQKAYLDVDINDAAKFKIKYINQRAFNVGIMYSSSKNKSFKNRNIPLEVFKKLLSIKNIQIYSFQIEDEFKPNERKINIVHLGEYFNDFYDTACAIKNMHLIISSDNVILNLAGALGKSTFGLLNKNHDYRWQKNKKTKWYDSVTLFFNSKINDWDRLLVKIKFDIDKYRIKLREKYLLGLIKIVKKDYAKDKLQSLLTQSSIYLELYNSTYKTKYSKKQILNLTKALEIQPDRYNTMANLATIYQLTGNKEKALEYWTKCYSKITSPDLLFNYGCFQCTMKNFDEFFKYYPMRFEKGADTTQYPLFTQPKWKGEKDVSDKTLLVHFEQGYGDTLLFSRYMNEASKLFKKVYFVGREATIPLIKDSFPDVEAVLKNNFSLEKQKFDYHCPIMDLQIALNIYPTDYNTTKWLKANREKVEDFKKYILENKFNIGIFWESQHSQTKRFAPLETFIPIAKIKNVQLYSLAIEKEDIEVNYMDNNINIINLGKHFKDFSDTAAAIENLDLVISTDSSVLNIAGGLGKKTFALFNHITEWRWYQLEGENVGWFKSVKPFHADKEDDFAPQIEKMITEITNLIKEKGL